MQIGSESDVLPTTLDKNSLGPRGAHWCLLASVFLPFHLEVEVVEGDNSPAGHEYKAGAVQERDSGHLFHLPQIIPLSSRVNYRFGKRSIYNYL